MPIPKDPETKPVLNWFQDDGFMPVSSNLSVTPDTPFCLGKGESWVYILSIVRFDSTSFLGGERKIFTIAALITPDFMPDLSYEGFDSIMVSAASIAPVSS